MRHINLKIPEHSYFFSFAQTDGTLTRQTRGRGRLVIEINEKDSRIFGPFQLMFPSVRASIRTRTRDTNLKNSYTSSIFSIHSLEFRNELLELGLHYGQKYENISSPVDSFCERDYIRGLIDGGGSVGITREGLPFISITVKSEKLKDYLLRIIERITGEKKRITRNTRDGIYNIMLNREKAQMFIKYLYYPRCLSLERKFKMARLALAWEGPAGMKKVIKKERDTEQDAYILTHNSRESCKFLHRTKSGVDMRLRRLRNRTEVLAK